VFAKLKLGRVKVSKVVSHGLGPHYRNKILKSVQNSGGFTLCTDSATFRQDGLSKHVDLVLVWWCEEAGEVRTEFIDYHSVGQETSRLQVDNIEATLNETGLSMAGPIAISRDNTRSSTNSPSIAREGPSRSGSFCCIFSYRRHGRPNWHFGNVGGLNFNSVRSRPTLL